MGIGSIWGITSLTFILSCYQTIVFFFLKAQPGIFEWLEAWNMLLHFFSCCRRIIPGVPAVLQCKYQKQNNHETSISKYKKMAPRFVKTQPNNSHLVLGLTLIGSCFLVCVFFLRRIHKFCLNSSIQPIPFPVQSDVPGVLRLFFVRFVTRRDSGVLEFYYRMISAVKQCKLLRASQSKNLNFFELSRVSSEAHPLTKKPED